MRNKMIQWVYQKFELIGSQYLEFQKGPLIQQIISKVYGPQEVAVQLLYR